MGDFTVEELHDRLRGALLHGARAGHLATHSTALVDLLYPVGPGVATPYQRAIQAEQLIKRGIATIGGNAADALSIIYQLTPGTDGTSMDTRRAQAGRIYGITAGAFRRPNREPELVLDLACEIYQLCNPEPGDAR
jgi:hypothetical protein